MKNFCVTSFPSVGCTFLDWSIHWISGQKKFYNTETGIENICQNPIQKINAHGHNKNFIWTKDQILQTIDQFDSWSPCNLNSFYLGPPKVNIDDVNNNIDYNSLRATEYNTMIDLVNKNETPVIFVNITNDYFYENFPRVGENESILTGLPLESIEEILKDKLKTFFVKEADNIWDLREKLALTVRPFYHVNVTVTGKHYELDCKTVWHDLEHEIKFLFEYLELNIDSNRFKEWVPIYHMWQKQQLKILRFGWNLDKITNAIVNNESLNLDHYDLDIWKEIVILHVLLYQHNLNIKGYGLENFPSNTKEIHTLLEDSNHIVDKYWL